MSPTDSLYQQLRSHLAYLQLTAAAEALPAALDQATATAQTRTEFLAQLLAIEVDATEARRPRRTHALLELPSPLAPRRLRLQRPAQHRRSPQPRPRHQQIHTRRHQHLVHRTGRRGQDHARLTTKRGASAWGDIFGDTTIAAAMLDRLLHRCAVINITGDSYRLGAHQARTRQHPTTTIMQPGVGNFADQLWGISLIAVIVPPASVSVPRSVPLGLVRPLSNRRV